MGTREDLELARRHVHEGVRHIARQREIIQELGSEGHPTEQAEELLKQLLETQTHHEEHVARLEQEALQHP